MTYGKVRISGLITLESGLHIGTSNAFAAIGATDSPVIKDPITNQPFIPGSSLKGKMRTLLARSVNSSVAENPGQDDARIRRLFGDSRSEEYRLGQVIFRDAPLVNADDLQVMGARILTEVKFENTIDRITAEANPRQIERAIRGSQFAFELIYEVTEKTKDNLVEDLSLLKAGLELLELDYLGGSGSRGYGKVRFQEVKAESVFGDVSVPVDIF